MTLIDQIQAIREERDRLKEAIKTAQPITVTLGTDEMYRDRAEKLAAELASLRARVTEYLAARDRSGGLDPLGGDEVEWIAACKASDLAEAALRAEAQK